MNHDVDNHDDDDTKLVQEMDLEYEKRQSKLKLDTKKIQGEM